MKLHDVEEANEMCKLLKELQRMEEAVLSKQANDHVCWLSLSNGQEDLRLPLKNSEVYDLALRVLVEKTDQTYDALKALGVEIDE